MSKKSRRHNEPIDREEEEFQRQVRKRHIELFPEEYDHMFDSISEARERRKGISPMNLAHLEQTNKRRIAMGFEPLSANGYATSSDTFAWVETRMRAGEIAALPQVSPLKDEGLECALKWAEAGQKQPQSKVRTITEILASDAFLSASDDRNDPDVIAFRILGALFELYPDGSNEPLFHSYIRNTLPKLPKSEYERLFQVAMKEWTEAYGF